MLLFELLSFFLLIQLKISSRPNYTIQSRHHYGDYNPHFGSWHLPNRAIKHTKSCFDVIYKTNSYGAVDINRDIKGKNRTIVIGDSNVEGFGLDQEKRFSNILEKKLKIPHLNFGTSGHFGTTQYKLLYEKLASKFEHSKVLLFITVLNDFEDDSYSFGKKVHSDRYRPYLIKSDDKYELTYLNSFKKDFYIMNEIKNFLNNFTHSYHLLRYLKSLATSEKIISTNKKTTIDKKKSSGTRYSYYEVFKDEGLDLMKYNLSAIQQLVLKNNANLFVILLPMKPDMEIFIENKKKIPRLTRELEEFSKNNKINFIDILLNIDFSKYKTDDLFFACDSHFNILGNKLVADIIENRIYEKN